MSLPEDRTPTGAAMLRETLEAFRQAIETACTCGHRLDVVQLRGWVERLRVAGAVFELQRPGDSAGELRAALRFLRMARDHARRGEAPRALERIRAAIRSAEGAVRHAELERVRKDRQEGGSHG